MDFTREPIIETVITPRDGYKIVVRSSKTSGQEEHFVDAVEVISFGGTTFFRSLERPKAFLVPASDYEVLEVREARVVLKNVGLDRSIKIAGGRETPMRSSREDKREDKREERSSDRKDESSESATGPQEIATSAESKSEGRGQRRDRRRGRGRRRGDSDESQRESQGQVSPPDGASQEEKEPSRARGEAAFAEDDKISNPIFSPLLTPPPTLISETLHRYRDNALFQSAFYTREELEGAEAKSSLEPPGFEPLKVSIDVTHKVRELKPDELPLEKAEEERLSDPQVTKNLQE